jgi:hypothetical protein
MYKGSSLLARPHFIPILQQRLSGQTRTIIAVNRDFIAMKKFQYIVQGRGVI